MTLHNDKCPVCGMKANADLPSVEYQKMFFHFCSKQCRETFIARPNLYRIRAGNVRNEAIKRRTMHLAEQLDNEVTELLIPYLTELMGVKDVVIEEDKVHVTYDLLQVTEEQIENALVDVGVQLGSGWVDRFRRGWVHDSEEIELDNLAAPPAPCCNRAPPRIK